MLMKIAGFFVQIQEYYLFCVLQRIATLLLWTDPSFKMEEFPFWVRHQLRPRIPVPLFPSHPAENNPRTVHGLSTCMCTACTHGRDAQEKRHERMREFLAG
jgi:hypothetical protein